MCEPIEVEANKTRVASNLKRSTTARVVLSPVDQNNKRQTYVVVQQEPCAAGSFCPDKPTQVGSVVLTVAGT